MRDQRQLAAELLAESCLVIGGGGPGFLLRLAVVLVGQILDAVAEDFAQQRRVRRQKRPQREFGMRAAPSSRDLPGGAVLGILQHDAHGGEFVADAVGFLEVFGLARGIARGDQVRDLCSRRSPTRPAGTPPRSAAGICRKPINCALAFSRRPRAWRPWPLRRATRAMHAKAFGVLRSSSSASSASAHR